MAKRKKVPLFEVIQESRLKEQMRADREREKTERESRRTTAPGASTTQAKSHADLFAPRHAAKQPGVFSRFGSAAKAFTAALKGPAKPAGPAPVQKIEAAVAKPQPVRQPEPTAPASDPTAGRSAGNLRRRPAKSVVPPEPIAPPPPVQKSVQKSVPIRLGGRTSTAHRVEEPSSPPPVIKPPKKPGKPIGQTVREKLDPMLRALGYDEHGFAPTPLAAGLAAILVLGLVGYGGFGLLAGGDDSVEIADADLPGNNRLPLRPDVIDIGDPANTAPPDLARVGLPAEVEGRDAPLPGGGLQPVAVRREAGLNYLIFASFGPDERVDDGRGPLKIDAALDLLRQSGIDATAEPSTSLPGWTGATDALFLVSTEGFTGPSDLDLERSQNAIISLNEQETDLPPFQVSSLYKWPGS